MPAPYNAKAVANFFLERGRPTQMQLHKLLYYAHGWHLGFNASPLLDEQIEAWRYGPVVPSIYREFKMFGSRPIDRLATQFDWRANRFVNVPPVRSSDELVHGLLTRVWTVYGKFTAARLSALTHQADSPWTEAKRDNPGCVYFVIPDESIRNHFAARVAQGRNGS